MANRSTTIETLETTTEQKSVQMKIYYEMGGANYFTGQNTARGYYLHATPIKSEGNFISFTAFSGYKELIEATNKFSQKKLDQLAATIKQDPKYWALLNAVLGKNSLVLKNPELVPNPLAAENQSEIAA